MLFICCLPAYYDNIIVVKIITICNSYNNCAYLQSGLSLQIHTQQVKTELFVFEDLSIYGVATFIGFINSAELVINHVIHMCLDNCKFNIQTDQFQYR